MDNDENKRLTPYERQKRHRQGKKCIVVWLEEGFFQRVKTLCARRQPVSWWVRRLMENEANRLETMQQELEKTGES